MHEDGHVISLIFARIMSVIKLYNPHRYFILEVTCVIRHTYQPSVITNDTNSSPSIISQSVLQIPTYAVTIYETGRQ